MANVKIEVNLRIEKVETTTISSNNSGKVRIKTLEYSLSENLNFIQLKYEFEYPLSKDTLLKVKGDSVFKVHDHLDKDNSMFIAAELFKHIYKKVISKHIDSTPTSKKNLLKHSKLSYPTVSFVPYLEVFQNIPSGHPHFIVTIPSHN